MFVFSGIAALVNYAATFAVGFLLSLYLQKVRGFSPNEAGLVLVCQPLVQAILSPLAGRLSDRIEPGAVASVGMGLCFIGLVFLTFVGVDSTVYYIIACLIFLGLGFALFSSPNTKAIMSSVDRCKASQRRLAYRHAAVGYCGLSLFVPGGQSARGELVSTGSDSRGTQSE